MNKKPITKTQSQILRLLNLGLSVKEIAKRRKKTTQSVYKILYRLESNGWLNLSQKKRGVLDPKPSKIRLHGLMYQIKILYSGSFYNKIRKNCNLIDFGDFKIHLFNKSITLWIIRDFISTNATTSKNDSMIYLNKTLSFLERKYNIVLIKKGYQNIKEVKSHYARMHDPLAKKGVDKKEFVTLKDPGDNKEWLRFDKSINPPELETTHPEKSYMDMKEIIEPFYTMLKHNPYFLQDLLKLHEKELYEIKTLIAHNKNLNDMFHLFLKTILKLVPNTEYKDSEPENLNIPDYIG